MRIIHQVYGREPQASGTGAPYGQPIVARPPKQMPGFQLEVMASSTSPLGAEETVYIEGDGAAIKAMLAELLKVVRLIEDDCRERYARERSKTKKCKRCEGWFLHSHNCAKFRSVVKRERASLAAKKQIKKPKD